jgi:hypothetical protein
VGSVCTDPGAKCVLGQVLDSRLRKDMKGKTLNLERMKSNILKMKYVIILAYPNRGSDLLQINVQILYLGQDK